MISIFKRVKACIGALGDSSLVMKMQHLRSVSQSLISKTTDLQNVTHVRNRPSQEHDALIVPIHQAETNDVRFCQQPSSMQDSSYFETIRFEYNEDIQYQEQFARAPVRYRAETRDATEPIKMLSAIIDANA